MLDANTCRQHVEEFLTASETARYQAERRRDYVHNKQWTQEEEARLRARGQAPVVVNRIAPKIEGLKGLLIERQTDPKAYPRTKAHEDAAHAVTDALRYVADNTDLDSVKLEVADDVFVEGCGAVVVEVVERPDGETEIDINRIPWDRFYFDPHSRRGDFHDARYLGVIMWMDADDAREMFGAAVDDISHGDDSTSETLADRPRWAYSVKGRKRVRIATEYARVKGKWHYCIFSGDTDLDAGISPYLDEDGKPDCPIVALSCRVDRDNQRYGEAEFWMDLQDEVNHRRSKALHILSQRQTKGRRGAILDVAAMKRELAKPDGHVEVEGDLGDFDILQTGDMAAAQFALLEEAKGEIDAVGFNAQLSGERQGNLSGRAIRALQAGGVNEIAPLFARLNNWERRVYRQIWARIRQFWTRERWIRVTDMESNLRWVGFNTPITVQQLLEERIEDEARPLPERQQASQIYEAMVQASDPRLQQITEVRNPVPELDIDIKLEQSLDNVNTQAEQFELLAQMAQGRPEIPFTTLLRLSSFRDKDELIEQIEKGQSAQMEAAQGADAAEIQKEEQKIAAKVQGDLAINQQKIEADVQALQSKLAAEASADERKAEMQMAIEQRKAALAMEMELMRAAIQKGTHDNVAQNPARQVIDIPDADRISRAMQGFADAKREDTQALERLVAELQRPVQVERDASGRINRLV